MNSPLSELVERTRWTVEPFDEVLVAAVAGDGQAFEQWMNDPAPEPRRLLPIAPRPFAQLAVRHYRMHLEVPFGYAAALLAGNLQWYRSGRRRRPVHQQCPSRRREVWAKRLRRAYWHRVAEVMYWGKVA